MPSPVAHSLAGLAVAHFAFRRFPSREPRGRVIWIGAFVFAANAADMDFLPGFLIGNPNLFHHGPTHALIAAVVFGLLAAAVARLSAFEAIGRFGFLMGLSYLTPAVQPRRFGFRRKSASIASSTECTAPNSTSFSCAAYHSVFTPGYLEIVLSDVSTVSIWA